VAIATAIATAAPSRPSRIFVEPIANPQGCGPTCGSRLAGGAHRLQKYLTNGSGKH
jgi:hypothetical protein